MAPLATRPPHLLLALSGVLAAWLTIATPSLPAAPSFTIADAALIADISGPGRVRFKNGDSPDFASTAYDDSGWEPRGLPDHWLLDGGAARVSWYRLRLRFPEHPASKAIGISLGTVCDSDELYLNGVRVGGMGNVEGGSYAYDRERIYELPASLIRWGVDNIIALRNSGLEGKWNGPAKGSFHVGPHEELLRRAFLRGLLMVAFDVLYLGMAIYFLIFFLGSRARDHLSLAVYAAAVALYLFLQTQVKYMLSSDFLILKRIEYMVLFSLVPLALNHVLDFLGKRKGFPFTLFLLASAAAMAAAALSRGPVAFERVFVLVVIPSYALPAAWFTVLFARDFRAQPAARPLLAAYLLLFASFANDVMVNFHLYDLPKLSLYTFTLVFLAAAATLRASPHGQRAGRNIMQIDRELLERITDFVDAHYAEELSRERLAAELGLGEDRLGKLFKAGAGKSLSGYIMEKRVRKAAELLEKTDDSVIRIAYAVGFESMPTFYRRFKEVMGCSASAHRRATRGK